MKWLFTLLLAFCTSLTLLSCEEIPQAATSTTEQTQGTPEDGTSDGENMVMNITAGGRTITATLAENAAAKELADRLKKGPVTVRMSPNEFEHYGPLGFSLTTQNERITAISGDIMLYSGRYICVFYGDNTWSYTPLGKVDGLPDSELKAFFGTGDISVTFSLK